MAFDDAPHNKEDLYNQRENSGDNVKKTDLIGIVCREYQLLHVSRTKIDVDGIDSTEKILQLLNNNPYLAEIRAILIDSPTLAGFNILNPFLIYDQAKIPVILIPDRKPQADITSVYEKIFPDRLEQIKILKDLPLFQELKVSLQTNLNINTSIYFHSIGIDNVDVIPLLKHLALYTGIPEPLRLAHIIASSYKEISNNQREENNDKE